MTNVLIVEDHASMRESLTTALTAGETFLWWVRCQCRLCPRFCKHLHPDLVLMDVCTEGGASG